MPLAPKIMVRSNEKTPKTSVSPSQIVGQTMSVSDKAKELMTWKKLIMLDSAPESGFSCELACFKTAPILPELLG